MSSATAFSAALASDGKLTEADIAVAVAWYLMETASSVPSLDDVVGFITGNHIRPQINKARLRARLKARKDISVSAAGLLVVPLRQKQAFQQAYERFLKPAAPVIVDTILVASEFVEQRRYVRALVDQINLSNQFDIFDGCAVLMRRLMEVLIIEAYENHGKGFRVESAAGYLPLSALIGELTSGRDQIISGDTKGARKV